MTSPTFVHLLGRRALCFRFLKPLVVMAGYNNSFDAGGKREAWGVGLS